MEKLGSEKGVLSSSASIFRLWVSENPPDDGVLLRFVTDLVCSFELCDGNFEKILGRMKYVDEFTSGFVESIQGRVDVIEKYGVLIDRLECRIQELEGNSGGSDEGSSGEAEEGGFERSGVSGVEGGPARGGLVSGVGPGGDIKASVEQEQAGEEGSG